VSTTRSRERKETVTLVLIISVKSREELDAEKLAMESADQLRKRGSLFSYLTRKGEVDGKSGAGIGRWGRPTGGGGTSHPPHHLHPNNSSSLKTGGVTTGKRKRSGERNKEGRLLGQGVVRKKSRQHGGPRLLEKLGKSLAWGGPVQEMATTAEGRHRSSRTLVDKVKKTVQPRRERQKDCPTRRGTERLSGLVKSDYELVKCDELAGRAMGSLRRGPHMAKRGGVNFSFYAGKTDKQHYTASGSRIGQTR